MASSLVAIVTGAARGIGLDVSRRLMESGYLVCLVDINEELGKAAQRNLETKHGSGKSIFVKCDVSSKEEFKAAFDKTKEDFGKIDLLINNAGIVDEQDPQRTVAVNLMGTIYGCELALENMGKNKNGNGGFVINMSSISGLLPYVDTPTYVATKHAIIGLTRSYGHEIHYKISGVTFAAICPHYTDTAILVDVKRLGVYTPKDEKVDPMPISKVTDGIIKILNDKINGSILLVLKDKMDYEKIPQHLQNIPTALH